MKRKIRILVADDSPFVCRLLSNYIQSSSDMEVIGIAQDGSRALELIKERDPDAITLDLEMPIMGGLEALDVIMKEFPKPVVVISGVSKKAADATLEALELGAVDFILKYVPGQQIDPESFRKETIAKVKAAAKIRVIRNISKGKTKQPAVRQPKLVADPEKPLFPLLAGGVVVIGASTGGPLALRELLGQLPSDFPAAVLLVQHIPHTFTKVLASQLNKDATLPVSEARHGETLRPGRVYLAPGDHHLMIDGRSRIILNMGPEIGGHRPSINVTMQAVAQIYGSSTVGVILTGMGDDGSLGLLAIRNKGGKTYAQDASSCTVNGMPKSAIDRGVVDHVAPPQQIGLLLASERDQNRRLAAK